MNGRVVFWGLIAVGSSCCSMRYNYNIINITPSDYSMAGAETFACWHHKVDIINGFRQHGLYVKFT